MALVPGPGKRPIADSFHHATGRRSIVITVVISHLVVQELLNGQELLTIGSALRVQYIHRVGRTGRNHRPGHAYTFFTRNFAAVAPALVKHLAARKQVRALNVNGGVGSTLSRGFVPYTKRGVRI
eukprot:1177297-Prorocentrum_minimum.AAC.1